MSTVSTKLRAWQDAARDVLADMSPRDRSMLIGLVIAAVVAVVGGSTWWMNSTLGTLESRVADRQETLRLIRIMGADHGTAAEQAIAIEEQLRKHAGTDLSAFMEQAAKNVEVSDRLNSVREKSSSSDDVTVATLYTVEFSKLTVAEMSNLLYELETTGYPLRIQSFKTKRKKSGDQKVLNVTFEIAAYKVVASGEESEG